MITFYDCETCDKRYESAEEALSCEEKGRPPRTLKPGVAWEHSHHDDQPDGTSGVILIVESSWRSGHWLYYRCWGFRDNGAGDNGPAEIRRKDSGYCGTDLHHPWSHGFKRPNTMTPRFKRARKALAKIGIKIVAFDGSAKCWGPAPEPRP